MGMGSVICCHAAIIYSLPVIEETIARMLQREKKVYCILEDI